METRATRRPGQKGTKIHAERYGDRLLFVRYRYDPETNTRVTTVELIVDRRPARRASALAAPALAAPSPAASARVEDSENMSLPARRATSLRAPGSAPSRAIGKTPSEALEPGLAALRIKAHETALHWKVKTAGGYWDPSLGFWVLRLDRARALGLASRVVVAPQ
jgi:hypothetical protein